MRIGERIHYILNEKRLSQTDLASYLDTAKSTINGWKKANRNPSSDLIVPICEFLGISIEYLLTGKDTLCLIDDRNYLKIESSTQSMDYRRGGITLKDDIIFTRFKEAREAAGISIEEAAKSAYLNIDDMINLEHDGTLEELRDQMEKVKEIDLPQFAALAYKYGVDLYWLLSGSVRPPAAVAQDGRLAYPPYVFMMEKVQQLNVSKRQAQLSIEGETSEEQQLLLLYQALDDKGRSFVMTLIKDYVESHTNLSYSPKTAGTGGGNIA